jgi:hypothetical protein
MRGMTLPLLFLAAVAVLCAGAFAIASLVAPAWPAGDPPRGRPAPAASPTPTLAARRWTAAPAASPVQYAPATATATPAPLRTAVRPTPTVEAQPVSTPTPTVTPTATAAPATNARAADDAFALVRPVRNSTGDCPGSYILGSVVDPFGAPLPGVSLRLADEYGNQQIQKTKQGAGEAGRYDFPLFGPPRRFFLSVVDSQGRPLSREVEIPHGVGPAASAQCHWADWKRQ